VHRSGDVLMPSIPSKEPLKEEAKHFLDCVANGKRPLTDSRHARQVTAVLEQAQAVLNAARTKSPA
jgi:predicted dehydrogenase